MANGSHLLLIQPWIRRFPTRCCFIPGLDSALPGFHQFNRRSFLLEHRVRRDILVTGCYKPRIPLSKPIYITRRYTADT
jgi:hypothetical protein